MVNKKRKILKKERRSIARSTKEERSDETNIERKQLELSNKVNWSTYLSVIILLYFNNLKSINQIYNQVPKIEEENFNKILFHSTSGKKTSFKNINSPDNNLTPPSWSPLLTDYFLSMFCVLSYGIHHFIVISHNQLELKIFFFILMN